jgi:hypothetical protein
VVHQPRASPCVLDDLRSTVFTAYFTENLVPKHLCLVLRYKYRKQT